MLGRNYMRVRALIVALAVGAAGCAPPVAAPSPTQTLPPVPVSTATPDNTPVLPPTQAPANPPTAVTFATPDGATASGQRSGAGPVAVIFSPMGDCVGDWAALAEAAAAQGLLALTIQWRACAPGASDDDLQRRFLDDLRGAIDYVREAGAERVILAGASLGGLASARLLAESGAVGLVVLAAPDSIAEWNVQLAASHLASAAPKLFIAAEDDTIVPLPAARALYELAGEPKQWQTYPGSAHGTHLFATGSGAVAQTRILDFILTAAAAPPLPPTPTPPPPFFTVSTRPVVSQGAPGDWDYPFTDPGAVTYHAGQFHMLRNGFRGWPAAVQIGYLTSPDGVDWTEQDTEPVFTTAEVPYAGLAALASSVLVEPDGTWVLYFYTWPSVTSAVGGGIGRATAAQPTGPWTPDPGLVLEPGPTGAWDADQVLAPEVVRTAEGYVMYYSGQANMRGQIGRAVSADGIHWTKYDDPLTTAAPLANSDPVFSPGHADAWDEGLVHQPRVFETPTGWAMLYRGMNTIRPPAMGLGLAVSADGLHWERSPRNPVLTPAAVPGSRAFWFTSAVQHAETVYLYWEVGGAGITSIYLATHSGPLE